MELKVSSSKPASLSPPDCTIDPEEKELSDEDDDDRDHKHRRRETRSQSLERDYLDQVYMRPYRKRNKLFENGHSFKANQSQASESWKNYNISPLDKGLTVRFETRHPALTSLSRTPFDLNQRIRTNQTFYGAGPGRGRGRGRHPASWNQLDTKFSSVDIASQILQPASMAPSRFCGRGLPNVSNFQDASFAFGLIPRVPNGGLDTLHSIGFQGTLRPPLNFSLNMSITRQRCRDFEERGFCLRGEMCPMEHGGNRIVVEDVQSLSQFNLSVPLPSAQLLALPAGTGLLSSVGASSNTFMNSKGAYSKGSKTGVTDKGLGLNATYSDSTNAGGADLYDPDQPLWNNNGPDTSPALAALHSSNDETESLLNEDYSNHHHVRVCDTADNEFPVRNAGTATVSQNTSMSVSGRIASLKNRSNVKEKNNATVNSSVCLENETKEERKALPSLQTTSHRRKRIIDGDAIQKNMDPSSKAQSNSIRNIRKPSQKALRTLFVSNIPQKSTGRDALLSHFRKFGEVVDIYIPLNSERAFVQFSKQEEAEAAIKSPDAVMGNRFIKLWWASRDSIPGDGISSGVNLCETSHGMTAASVPAHPSVANKVKDNNLQSAVLKGGNIVPAADVSLPAPDHPTSVMTNSPKVPPKLRKKRDNLEQLKEELRKKRELLDQKRNDFCRQLDKLQKQAGVKGEVVSEQAAKKLKVGIAADLEKATAMSSDPTAAVASRRAEMMTNKNKIVENVVSSKNLNTAMALQESSSFKRQIRPLAPVGPPFLMNKYKLDNRPTAFRIIPPLPAGFADVAVLKEHFLSYGDLATVELEDGGVHEDDKVSDALKNCSARVNFTTRFSAERAFLNGKCWQGQNLQFMWLMPSTSSNDLGTKEKTSSPLKGYSDTDVHQEEKLSSVFSQEGAASGNAESENSERKSSVEQAELQEVSQPSPTPKSGEEESFKDKCLSRKDVPIVGMVE